MALTTRIKNGINRVLRSVNLRVETLTAERAEARRLRALEASGYFDQPVFPVPSGFRSMDPQPILDALEVYRERFEDFTESSRNDVGYSFSNPWYSSPDAEVLYTFIRRFKPKRIIEVGSGHSTQVIRQAILDGGLASRLVCIDPSPRLPVATLADEFHRKPIEQLSVDELTDWLGLNDVLFIDSSHILTTGGDVAFLYLHVLPALRPGVLIHIHDVFLPYEYPRQWVLDEHRGYNEQYLVQAILMFSDAFEVLWAGYYLQRTRPDFGSWFPHCNGRMASSLWLRKL